MEWNLDQLKVEEIMRYMVEIGLFQVNQSTNRVVCLKLANRLDESAAKNPEIRAAINKIRSTGLIESTNTGLAYVIKSGEKYKIGKTVNLHRRLGDYATTNPDAVLVHSIETVDAGLLETTLHKYFKSKRIDKSEWFNLSDCDVARIKRVSNGDKFIESGFESESFPIDSGTDKIRLDETRLDQTRTAQTNPLRGEINNTEGFKSADIAADTIEGWSS